MRLYHFTDERNIPSIRAYGLLSWNRLVGQCISHVPGSNNLSRELDMRRNLQDYIRLCMDKDHPMAYIAQRDGRVKKLVWLEIDEAVLANSKVLYASDNATANRTIINADQSTVLYSTARQREILILGVILPRYIVFPASHSTTASRRISRNGYVRSTL